MRKKIGGCESKIFAERFNEKKIVVFLLIALLAAGFWPKRAEDGRTKEKSSAAFVHGHKN